MKTEQEQIEKMARIMCGYCSTDGKCAVSKNGREPDICANVDTRNTLKGSLRMAATATCPSIKTDLKSQTRF